ncbi:MAG: ATP-binding cassette domain-containing protein [Alphaproteobacteria bacterium]|nr:ATP-binding cassette domain-containing protein [Alphaproteobacteria bacterium]
MSDLLLSVEDALVLIAGKPFFQDLTLHIQAGRKIALVGKNGAGKTTLMNLITGDKEVDDGRRWVFEGVTIGYMQQHVDPIPGQSVKEFIFSGFTRPCEEWEEVYKIERVVEPIGLKPHDMMTHLSGGQLRRAALARALVEEPDILLLDEPTNHMDLETIEWLEQYLKSYRGSLVCISHDRAFLANISDRVFWLDRGKLKVSPRGFAHFEEWSQDLLDQEARALHNRERKLELELEWANRGVKARVKRNVRRVELARSEKEKLEADKAAYRRVVSRIELPPATAAESSHNVAEFINAQKTYLHPQTGEEKIILEKFNMRIKIGDRVGIIGHNGSGKTTFLKMLIGEVQPDGGKVKLAKDLHYSYFDQKRSALDPDKTLQQNLCPDGGDHLDVRGKPRHVCGYLKDFLFDPSDAWRKVSTLSGGQKNRLLLAKVLADPGTFLILDEPTNDLDMDTLDMLEEVLTAYDGTLIVVSHDRDFLDQVVTKMLAFEGEGRIEGIVGGYSDYLAFKKSQDAPKTEPDTKIQNLSKKQPKAKEAPTPSVNAAVAGKLSFNMKHELERLPAQIEKLESDIAAMEALLANPDFYMQDPKAFDKCVRETPKLRAALEKAEERWLELETLRQNYEKQG